MAKAAATHGEQVSGLGLTEADIEALAADGAFEIETDPDPNAPLVRLTRKIASQYVDRFQTWADAEATDSPDSDVDTELALEAIRDVDRLAATTGDEALQSALASLPRERGETRWPTFLQTWIDRIAGVLGAGGR